MRHENFGGSVPLFWKNGVSILYGLTVVPSDRLLVSSHRLSVVAMLLSKAV